MTFAASLQVSSITLGKAHLLSDSGGDGIGVVDDDEDDAEDNGGNENS